MARYLPYYIKIYIEIYQWLHLSKRLLHICNSLLLKWDYWRTQIKQPAGCLYYFVQSCHFFLYHHIFFCIGNVPLSVKYFFLRLPMARSSVFEHLPLYFCPHNILAHLPQWICNWPFIEFRGHKTTELSNYLFSHRTWIMC